MADVAQLRKRVHSAIEAARREHADRRARAAEAERIYGVFLESAAIPAFRTMANVLRSEGMAWDVTTPSGSVQLVSDRHRGDAISLSFDATLEPPQPIVTVTRAVGGRVLSSERPVKAGTPGAAGLSEDDVTEMLLDELRPWLAR
jgi:hypothetical protein